MLKRRRRKLPEESTAKIESTSHDGRGIAHINGKITFIQNALSGEKVFFKYLNTRRSFDEGDTIKVLESSLLRIQPLCQHYKLCGGCSLQHLTHEHQIEHKQQVLLHQLEHFGKVQPEEILPPLVGPIWGYRHKARLGVRYVPKKEQVLVGFRERNGRFVTDMSSCETLHPSIGKKIAALRNLIFSLQNFETIPQIEVAVGKNKTALIFRNVQPLTNDDHKKLCEFGKLENFEMYIQPGGPESVQKIWPTDTSEQLSYHLPDQDIEIIFHPTDFTQINHEMNHQMINQIIKLLEPNKEDNILDLFCGLGNLTLPLAKYCNKIIGIEVQEQSIRSAQQNAKHNKITNVEFFAANLFKDQAKQSWANEKYTKIIINPPRTGAEEIIHHFPQFAPQKIAYISCNPATLARDAGVLVNKYGYRLVKTGIMDMFPHTSHMESLALFEK